MRRCKCYVGEWQLGGMIARSLVDNHLQIRRPAVEVNARNVAASSPPPAAPFPSQFRFPHFRQGTREAALLVSPKVRQRTRAAEEKSSRPRHPTHAARS